MLEILKTSVSIPHVSVHLENIVYYSFSDIVSITLIKMNLSNKQNTGKK